MFVVVGRVSQLVGGFVCQRVLFQGVVGVVDVVALLWPGKHPLLSRCVCLCVSVFVCRVGAGIPTAVGSYLVCVLSPHPNESSLRVQCPSHSELQ